MQEQLKQVEKKMQSIAKENSAQQKVLMDEYRCENPRLLEQVFGHFLEMVAIHFDDIF